MTSLTFTYEYITLPDGSCFMFLKLSLKTALRPF